MTNRFVSVFGLICVVVLWIILFVGCGTPPTICTGPQHWVDTQGTAHTLEDSQRTALCRIDPYWAETELALFAVNTYALETERYEPEAVYIVIDAIRGFYYSHVPEVTVAQLATFVAVQLKDSPELFVVNKVLQRYQKFPTIKLDAFSWHHINRHLVDQELLAKMYE